MERILIRGKWHTLTRQENGSQLLETEDGSTVGPAEWDRYCDYCRKLTRINFRVPADRRATEIENAGRVLARF